MEVDISSYENILKYQRLMIDNATSFLETSGHAEDKELNAVAMNVVLNRPGPRHVQSSNATNEAEEFFSDFFMPFTEVYSALEDLLVCQTYFRRGFRKGMGFTEEQYMRYHVTNFLNGLYVTKNRIFLLARRIQRHFRYDGDLKTIIEAMTKGISVIFKNIDQARGLHVHQSQYTDTNIDQIRALCLLEKSEDPKFRTWVAMVKKDAFKEIRKKWCDISTSYISAILKALDLLFSTIVKEIAVDGKLKQTTDFKNR